MSATELEEYMKLTTVTVEGNVIDEEQIVWEVTVMSPEATIALLNILPEDGVIESEFAFIRDNYMAIAKDMVYPSILSPKIPFERLSFADVILLFPVLRDMSFPKEDEGDEFRPE